MLKKKFFAKALAFALVMGTVSVYGSGVVSPISIVQAGDTTVKITYANYTAEITPADSSDKYVFLEVLKDQAGTKVSATYCYPVNDGKAVVNLSFLKAAKDQYLRAYGTTLNTDGTYKYSDITKVAAQPSKLSIKYDALKGLIDGKTKEAIKIEDGYEFKSLYGSTWADLEANSLKGMEIAGNTIVLRKKAVDDTTNTTKNVPASAEIKVKIPAIPKAPKVKIDYVKGTINFGKGTQYVKITDVETESKWVKNADSKPLELLDIIKKLDSTATTLPTSDISLVVRTAKTDKKAASALSFVTIPKVVGITNTAEGEVIPGTTDKKMGGSIKYSDTSLGEDKLLTWENTTKGISLKAEKVPFQYYDETKKDWKTIATGKAVEVKLKDNGKVKVRVAGKKETKTEKGAFASGEAELICALLPADITISGPTELTNMTATPYTLEIKDGNGEVLTRTTGIEWTTSDSNIATVANGTVTAKKSGTVTITAKLGKAEGKITITVEIPTT